MRLGWLLFSTYRMVIIHHVCLIFINLGSVGALPGLHGRGRGMEGGGRHSSAANTGVGLKRTNNICSKVLQGVFTSNNLRGESEGRLEAILSCHSLVLKC